MALSAGNVWDTSKIDAETAAAMYMSQPEQGFWALMAMINDAYGECTAGTIKVYINHELAIAADRSVEAFLQVCPH